MKMKMKTMLMVAMVCFVGSTVFANFVDIKPSQDAFINYNAADTTLGTTDPGSLQVSQNGETTGGKKSYTMWDMSAYDTADILGIESLQFYQYAGATVSRASDIWLLTRTDGLETWSENTITWTNAPFNDWANSDTPARGSFNNYSAAGELTPVIVGHMSTGSYGWKTVTWGDAGSGGTLSAEDAKALVLAALTSGDQIVTLGLNYRGSQERTVVFASKDHDDPSWAPKMTLQVIPEPATLVLLGLGGLSLLRKRK